MLLNSGRIRVRKDRILEINTKQFGVVKIDETKIITMPSGMPGFEGMDRYILLDNEETKPFFSFQNVDEPGLAFVIIDPFLFKPDYKVNLNPVIKEMGWNKDEELITCVIVNATDPDPLKMTANLIGPLVINSDKCEAVQMVMYDTEYSHKFPLFNQNSGSEKTGT